MTAIPEIEALRARVERVEAELQAERARRQQEERERAYWAEGDQYLFGNRLRWAGRVLKYWWNTRVRTLKQVSTTERLQDG